MFKAKVLALEHSLRGPISVAPEFAFTHQRYPPLVSHVANLPALCTGRFDDQVAQSVFPWYAVALVLVLHGDGAHPEAAGRGYVVDTLGADHGFGDRRRNETLDEVGRCADIDRRDRDRGLLDLRILANLQVGQPLQSEKQDQKRDDA
jgi:hypothetical protein